MRFRATQTGIAEFAHERRPRYWNGAVDLHAYTRDGTAFIVVRDEGAGIPKEQEDRIFEPFFTTKPNGSGLGLAIASKIVEQHGGLLTARNAPGKGLTMVLQLPVKRDPA